MWELWTLGITYGSSTVIASILPMTRYKFRKTRLKSRVKKKDKYYSTYLHLDTTPMSPDSKYLAYRNSLMAPIWPVTVAKIIRSDYKKEKEVATDYQAKKLIEQCGQIIASREKSQRLLEDAKISRNNLLELSKDY